MALDKNITFKHKHLAAGRMHVFCTVTNFTVPALSPYPRTARDADGAQTAKGKLGFVLLCDYPWTDLKCQQKFRKRWESVTVSAQPTPQSRAERTQTGMSQPPEISAGPRHRSLMSA